MSLYRCRKCSKFTTVGHKCIKVKARQGVMRYEDTPIGQVTERAKRDMDLIRTEVERGDWKAVASGVKFQAEEFMKLLVNLREMARRSKRP